MTNIPKALTVLIAASVLFVAFPPAAVQAAHQVSACGRILEYAPPPGDDPPSGLGLIRLATATGEVQFFFHHRNAQNAPSTTEPGATEVGASVCFSGTHVESASPVRRDYISPYQLVLAAAASLPSTATGVENASRTDRLLVTSIALGAFATLLAAALLRRRRVRLGQQRAEPAAR